MAVLLELMLEMSLMRKAARFGKIWAARRLVTLLLVGGAGVWDEGMCRGGVERAGGYASNVAAADKHDITRPSTPSVAADSDGVLSAEAVESTPSVFVDESTIAGAEGVGLIITSPLLLLLVFIGMGSGITAGLGGSSGGTTAVGFI